MPAKHPQCQGQAFLLPVFKGVTWPWCAVTRGFVGLISKHVRRSSAVAACIARGLLMTQAAHRQHSLCLYRSVTVGLVSATTAAAEELDELVLCVFPPYIITTSNRTLNNGPGALQPVQSIVNGTYHPTIISGFHMYGTLDNTRAAGQNRGGYNLTSTWSAISLSESSESP